MRMTTMQRNTITRDRLQSSRRFGLKVALFAPVCGRFVNGYVLYTARDKDGHTVVNVKAGDRVHTNIPVRVLG